MKCLKRKRNIRMYIRHGKGYLVHFQEEQEVICNDI